MPAEARIVLEEETGVAVVRFLDSQLMDDRAVREAAEQAAAALPSNAPILVILDFSGLSMISSAMIGRLVLLQRRVAASGGRMRLCELSPAVRDTLKTTNLDRILIAASSRHEARDAFADIL